MIDLDASLITRTRRSRGARTWKKGFGFHPLLGFVDHGAGGTGEPVAELLRPGKAGSNTAVDHVAVLDAALAQLPASRCAPDDQGRVAVLVRTDAAGATKEFAATWPDGVEFSVGANLAHFDIQRARALPGRRGPRPTRRASPAPPKTGVQIEPRDGAWVAEATGLVDLSAWPAGTRLILRKERPHPGAQLRITDADGMRVTGFLTNTRPGGPAASSPTWNCATAATPASRTASARLRTPGCATCPSTTRRPEPSLARHRRPGRRPAGLDRSARAARHGRDATSPNGCGCASWPSPDGSSAHPARRVLHIDPAWPWTNAITTAHQRLCALPAP